MADFEYFVGQPAEPISADTPQWSAPLPLQRQTVLGQQTQNRPKDSITYGDYFTAVRDFLTRRGISALARMAASAAGGPPKSNRIQKVTVHLIKHGALYHPALVLLRKGSDKISLILNVAVSRVGREVLPVEYRCLERLGRRFPQSFIPGVYGRGSGKAPAGQRMEMFAAQWLSDFHELHPSTDQSAGRTWRVWDTVRGPWCLSRNQMAAYHEQAAFILTYYYNPLKFEAILDWHLAAGDFVIRQDHDRIEVRLITVRRYAPLFAIEADTPLDLQAVLDGLVVFLLNTSLHLRLDRLDGVGELVWALDDVLPAIWQGFRRGLERMAALYSLPPEFIPGACDYLAAHGTDGLMRITRQVIEGRAHQADASALLLRHGAAHAAQLAQIIRETT